MILKDDVNQYNSLYHLALRWARSDVNNFPYADFIQSFNMAINRITAVVMRHDQSWNWTDRNSVTGLIDTSKTLTAGQDTYTLSTPWLKISRIRIKLGDGVTWRTLQKRQRNELSDDELAGSEIQSYYLLGNNLYLGGKPSYTVTNGIEVQFQNGPVHFTPTDENEEVGFSPLFEELGALMPALDYLEINGPNEQAVKVMNRIGIEPRRGVEGSGLLNALAVSYQERDNTVQTMTLKGNPTAYGLIDAYSERNPQW